MNLTQHLESVRESYLDALRQAIRKSREESQFMGAEVGVKPDAPPDSPPDSSADYRVFRIDLLIETPESPKPVIIMTERPGGALLGALSLGLIEVAVFPFAWEACLVWFRHPEPDFAPLRDWFAKWFEEKHEPDDDQLSGVVHYMSEPEPEGGGYLFETDLGSAPIASLLELLRTLGEMGATDVRIGSPDGADMDASIAEALRVSDLSPENFTKLVADLLRSLDEAEAVEIVAPFVVRVSSAGAGEPSTAHLENLWRRIQRIEPGHRPREIDRFLRMHRESAHLVSSGHKPGLETLRPVLKSTGFLDAVRRQMRTPEGPLPLVCLPCAADLFVLYVWDRPNGMQFVTTAEPAEFGLSPEQLHERALANYLAAPRSIELIVENGVSIAHTHDNYDSTLLLDDAFWQKQEEASPGALLVAVPSRDTVLFINARAIDAAARLRALVQTHMAGADHLISGTILERTATGWRIFTPPPLPAPSGMLYVSKAGERAVPHYTLPRRKPWWKFW